MTSAVRLGLPTLLWTVLACSPAKPSEEPQPEPSSSAVSSAAMSEPVTTATPEAAPSAKPAAAPKPKTKAELETEMAPPEKLFDVRPLLGTDPEGPLPALFAKLKKGMTAKELDAEFPGVGAAAVKFVTFTKQGKKWVKAGKGFPESQIREVLDLEYDDKGGLVRIGYIFDSKVVSDAFWDYLKKAAQARFGSADASKDVVELPAKGIKNLRVQKTDAKTYSFDVVF